MADVTITLTDEEEMILMEDCIKNFKGAPEYVGPASGETWIKYVVRSTVESRKMEVQKIRLALLSSDDIKTILDKAEVKVVKVK